MTSTLQRSGSLSKLNYKLLVAPLYLCHALRQTTRARGLFIATAHPAVSGW